MRIGVLVFGLVGCLGGGLFGQDDREVVRVFIFAGQSNMEGADSRASDIDRFPPFAGLGEPQENVRFWYVLGRENKTQTDEWIALQPVNNMVGPELSFARKVSRATDAPVAIIKCAAGGTHLGGDWNPDEPAGFEMYPLLIDTVRTALAELEQQGIEYRLEGFMWHQGENDMFEAEFMANYGANLSNFMDRVRQDLDSPNLYFYVGELCTKTIWGMDLRPRMHAISVGQRSATDADTSAEYIPTSHVGVEIGGGVGLHYHYGTLGQLEHGINYANAYLRNLGTESENPRQLGTWPYPTNQPIQLFILAGHRNMEGERAFVQQLLDLPDGERLASDDLDIAFKYSLGGGAKTSDGWEPLGPAGYYDTFGPELSFALTLDDRIPQSFAIAKFTHSGSQIIDWTPEGSEAETRNLYSNFIEFIQQSSEELRSKGHDVEIAGVFYHVGENDMSFGPYRREASRRVESFIKQSREDLGLPDLKWFVSQQPPTDHERVNQIDVVADFVALAESDPNLILLQLFDLPPQEKQLVIDTPGIVKIGELLAERFLSHDE